MPRIILSLSVIAVALGAITYGGTNAFFSDTETTTANVFTAGAVDLQIGNDSYYNGVFNDDTSWTQTDLTLEKFFDFADVKPNDYGEDTVSLSVDNNDAYLCGFVELTSNNENGCTEPEALVDGTCNDPGLGDGELDGLVHFLWWADDGDNVLEDDETVINSGNFSELGIGNAYPLALADSDENIWTGLGGPVAGTETYHIGKAWCFGEIGTDPIDQDDLVDAMSPADDNDNNGEAGEPADGGITCDGSFLGNESQTDSLTADVTFEAVQARHNDGFQCRGIECEIDVEETIIPDSRFEVPKVSTPQDWNVFGSPAGAWSVEWRDDVPTTFAGLNRPDPARLEIHKGVVGTPFEGEQYAELDSDWDGPSGSVTGEPASVSIFQPVPTTPGAEYQISFAFAARPNTAAATNGVEVEWGGDVVYSSGPIGDSDDGIDWQVIDITVTATTTETVLRFTDTGTADSEGTFIDDIKLFSEVCTFPDV